jgi:hypothetical protein
MTAKFDHSSNRTPKPDAASTPMLRRKVSGEPGHSTIAPPIVHDVVRSPGQQLDAATRADMEPRFGHDFSAVRVHTGTHAADSARAVGALAFAAGRHVVFGAGQYTPDTASGKRLLAHELTHVVQQAGVGSQTPESAATASMELLHVSPPEGAHEREADLVADHISRSPNPASESRAPHVSRGVLQRQPANTIALAKKIPPPDESSGEKRARAAKDLVTKLKAAGTTYKHESPRDWNNSKISDCSKFVQWVLEGAGESELFGRANGTTSAMAAIIHKLTTAESPGLRQTNPKIGDIMMWGGHVGIVYDLVDQKGTKYLVFAHMGIHGANLEGKTTRNGKDIYWLKASDTAKIDTMGDGAFLGFWTAP